MPDWTNALQIYRFLYAEVNIVAVFILGYILIRIKGSHDKQTKNIALSRVVFFTIVILVVDLFWILIDGIDSSLGVLANNVVNVLYTCIAPCISYLWLMYVETTLFDSAKVKKKKQALLSIPLMLLFAVTVSTPWTKLIFYIDAANNYHRGVLHFLQIIVTYGYLILATVLVLIEMIKGKNKQRRAENISLLTFFILPALGGVLTTFFEGIPATWPLTALSIFMVYINFQSYQISTDGLTGISNRRQFDRYLETTLNDTHDAQRTYLFLLDINNFKKINDTYGHPEGDEALKKTASILKKICFSKNAFLARYGGDEFAIIFKCDSEKDAIALKDEINTEFDYLNNMTKVHFPIVLSTGYDRFNPSLSMTAEDLLRRADEALYFEKKKYKSKIEI